MCVLCYVSNGALQLHSGSVRLAACHFCAQRVKMLDRIVRVAPSSHAFIPAHMGEKMPTSED